MTPTQQEAIHNMIKTPEELQAAWDKPRVFSIPLLQNRQAFIVTVVLHDTRGYHWMSCIRLYHSKKNKVKPPESYNGMEAAKVGLMLASELNGVGHEEDTRLFNSQWAMHIEKKVTGAELGELLKGGITGKTNGHKPGTITNQKAAIDLLNKFEKDLDSRIIKN